MTGDFKEKFKGYIRRFGFIPVFILWLLFSVESLARLNPLEALGFMLTNPLELVINVGILTLLFIFLVALFKMKYIALSLLTLLSIVLGIATKIKFDFRGTGALPTDFFVLGEGAQMTSALSTEFFLKTLVMVCIIILISIPLMRKIQLPTLTRSRRLIGIAISIFLVIPLCLFAPQWIMVNGESEVRKKTAMEAGSYLYFIAQINNGVETKGFVSNKVDIAHEIEEEFGGLIADIKTEESGEKPDIIYIQSESFFDPTEALGLENFSEDPLPFFHSLKEESDFFNVTSPVYGGDTVNAEFETLTGLSLNFFPEAMNVYVSYLNKPVVSLASILREDGYYALGIHPYNAAYYSRDRAYKHLGFNEFNSIETMERNDSEFINRAYSYPQALYSSDKELTKQIISNLEKGSERQNFIFAVSVQTHVPFGSNRNMAYNVTYTGNQITGQNDLEGFNGYLRNLRETDDALKDLMIYLKNRPKETIVVFYGDHQPILGGFSYAASLNASERQLRHTVPAFIWSNKETLATTQALVDMSGLGEKGLEAANVQMPNYFHILKDLRVNEKVSAFTSYYLLKDGEYYFKGEAEYERIYKKYFLMYKDILEGEHYIENGNKKWLVENNEDYKSAL